MIIHKTSSGALTLTLWRHNLHIINREMPSTSHTRIECHWLMEAGLTCETCEAGSACEAVLACGSMPNLVIQRIIDDAKRNNYLQEQFISVVWYDQFFMTICPLFLSVFRVSAICLSNEKDDDNVHYEYETSQQIPCSLRRLPPLWKHSSLLIFCHGSMVLRFPVDLPSLNQTLIKSAIGWDPFAWTIAVSYSVPQGLRCFIVSLRRLIYPHDSIAVIFEAYPTIRGQTFFGIPY